MLLVDVLVESAVPAVAAISASSTPLCPSFFPFFFFFFFRFFFLFLPFLFRLLWLRRVMGVRFRSTSGSSSKGSGARSPWCGPGTNLRTSCDLSSCSNSCTLTTRSKDSVLFGLTISSPQIRLSFSSPAGKERQENKQARMRDEPVSATHTGQPLWCL